MGQSTRWSPHRGEPSHDGSAYDRSLDDKLPLDGRRAIFLGEGEPGVGVDANL